MYSHCVLYKHLLLWHIYLTHRELIHCSALHWLLSRTPILPERDQT